MNFEVQTNFSQNTLQDFHFYNHQPFTNKKGCGQKNGCYYEKSECNNML